MAKKKIPSLIVEYASDNGNLYFLSVLEYRRENYLVIIDNISSEEIGAYVLDYAQQEKLDLRQLLSLVTYWFYRGSSRYPLSFEFSRLGITAATNRIYKTFELAHVTRLIGVDFRFDFESPPKVRRRRVNLIPAGTEIRLKRSDPERAALLSLQMAIDERTSLPRTEPSEQQNVRRTDTARNEEETSRPLA